MNCDNFNILVKEDSPNIDQESSEDCVFIFQNEQLEANKTHLSQHSPVFKKMFYGSLPANNIVITDIAAEDFKQVLNFVNNRTVDIQSVLEAWSLYYIAHKYILKEFGIICIDYVKNNLSISNLLMNYEFAEMYDISQLQHLCKKDIKSYVRGLFFQELDYHMKPSTLITLLEQDCLNISDNELIIGVLNWAATECDIKNISQSSEVIINLLQSLNILPYLVNLNFNIDMNIDNVFAVCCRLIKSFRVPNQIPQRRKLNHWNYCSFREFYKISGREFLKERDFITSELSLNRDCILYGLAVLAEHPPSGVWTNRIYNGEIHIKISKKDQSNIILVDTTVSRLMEYSESEYITLPKLIYLESRKTYLIEIGYRNYDASVNGRFKPSAVVRNYMSNIIDRKKNVTISFNEAPGGVIKGVTYYPV